VGFRLSFCCCVASLFCREVELRKLAPAEFPVCVTASHNPITVAWSGASHWAATDTDMLYKYSVSRADYEELGPELSARLFQCM
jgi:actin-related protein